MPHRPFLAGRMARRYRFPRGPVPAVGAIVFRGSASLLVKRGTEPGRGRWSLPGGALEVGETVEQAVVRETLEETGVVVRPIRVLYVRDFIEKRGERIRWHYVLIDILCAYERGEPSARTDAADARFVPLWELDQLDVIPLTRDVLQEADRSRDAH